MWSHVVLVPKLAVSPGLFQTPSTQNSSAVVAAGAVMCVSMQCHAFSDSDEDET